MKTTMVARGNERTGRETQSRRERTSKSPRPRRRKGMRGRLFACECRRVVPSSSRCRSSSAVSRSCLDFGSVGIFQASGVISVLDATAPPKITELVPARAGVGIAAAPRSPRRGEDWVRRTNKRRNAGWWDGCRRRKSPNRDKHQCREWAEKGEALPYDEITSASARFSSESGLDVENPNDDLHVASEFPGNGIPKRTEDGESGLCGLCGGEGKRCGLRELAGELDVAAAGFECEIFEIISPAMIPEDFLLVPTTDEGDEHGPNLSGDFVAPEGIDLEVQPIWWLVEIDDK